ncbi:MAG: PIG-L family deacetylase [Scytonema sp. PMC 1070.18]|nr:PIG-L family deacetylase [Scytonema sp. PMC 1070.18]
MSIRQVLKQVQKYIPDSWLYQLQTINSTLILRWILNKGSEPLPFSQKSAMVFSPHQDDETFGCGGTIALKREQGVPVSVVFLTDGQGCYGPDYPNKDEIVQIRKQEALQALGTLGVEPSKIHFLDKEDGTLQQLNSEKRQQIIEQLADLIKLYNPEEIYVPHSKDCHKDHEATYVLVKEAIAKAGIQAELLQYPIWMFWRAPLFIMLTPKDIASAYYFSITSVKDKKNEAVNSYSSQLKFLSPNFINRFLEPYEIFFKAKPL